MKALAEIVAERRKQYMDEYSEQFRAIGDGHEAHHRYYLWLVDFIGAGPRDVPFPLERLREAYATDRYMNNIPLKLWDMQHANIRRKAHGIPWSNSDTVCVLKAIARHMVEDTQ